MNLQSILIGTFTPPPVARSRIHRCGFEELPRYTGAKGRPEKDKNALNHSEKVVLRELVKFDRPASALEVGQNCRMNRNHCSIILQSLFKKGRLNRFKSCARAYVYTAKSSEAI